MRNNIRTLSLLLAVGLLLTACKKKDVFSQELYNELLTQVCPVDPIDASHYWTLTTRHAINIQVNGKVENMESLQVLNDNPLTNGKARIMAEQSSPVEGSYYTLAFAAPAVQTTFYAALRTSDGRYAVVPFTAGTNQVNFSGMTVGKTDAMNRQSFTYCFEETYPRPDDYDFNDCVMRLSLQPGSHARQLRLTVSLAAVGASATVAAAVRLINYKYDDVESVTIVGDKRFDEGYPLPLNTLKDTETLLNSRQGDAVIRLFDDAMWCMVQNAPSSSMMLTRYKVNVTRTSDDMHKQMAPISRTYVITFKESASLPLLGSFTLLDLDPFVITAFNGANWETHTYAHRDTQVLYEYKDNNELHMTWALCIPDDTTFRWPLEGTVMGTYKNGILTGAYRTLGHSFGEWAAKQTTATDWYLYPTTAAVY